MLLIHRMLVHAAVLVCFSQVAIVEQLDLASMFEWNIVIGVDAIPSEAYAAEEFQSFLYQATGHKLPVVKKVNRPERHVFIGSSKALADSSVSVAGGASMAPTTSVLSSGQTTLPSWGADPAEFAARRRQNTAGDYSPSPRIDHQGWARKLMVLVV